MKPFFNLVLLFTVCACASKKNWIQIETNIKEGLHDVEALGEEIAIAYSYGTGNLYKTFDGGENWQKLYEFDSIYFEQIQFLDEENGWIVGSPNKIYKTQDGGKTWADKSLQNESTQSYMYGMWFDDAETGYISALERTSKGFSTQIFQTQNGGASWKSVNQMDEMLLNLEKIQGILYASGNHVVIKNADKKDWSYVFKDTTNEVGQIRDIELNESGKMYAASFNGYIIDLEGEHRKNQITQNRIRNLVSLKNNEWIAVGDTNKEAGNLFISKDNGVTWKLSSEKFADIHRIYPSKKKLWIVGKEGLILMRKK